MGMCRAGEQVCKVGLKGRGVKMAHGWTCRKHWVLDKSFIGSGKWAGRTPGGRSPRVHDNGPSSAVSQSSRGVRWRPRAGSVAGWGGAEWSRRERGHDGDAVGGERDRESLLMKLGLHSVSKWDTRRNTVRQRWLTDNVAAARNQLAWRGNANRGSSSSFCQLQMVSNVSLVKPSSLLP